jgi:hypothetical protein
MTYKRLRIRYPIAYTHPVVFVMALGAVVVSFAELVTPSLIEQSRPAAVAGAGVAYAWMAFAFAGGLLICSGLLRRSPKSEIPGLILLGMAMCVQVYSVLSVAPLRGLFGAAIQGAFMAGCFLRAALIATVEGKDAHSGR